MKKTILITGGAGFIGSHVVRLFVNKYSDYKIVNLDNLTYAGNLENLSDVEQWSNMGVFSPDEKLEEPEGAKTLSLRILKDIIICIFYIG